MIHRRALTLTTFGLFWGILFLSSPGCLISRVSWPRPSYADSQWLEMTLSDSPVIRAETIYASAIDSEKNGLALCVDQYFETVLLTAFCRNEALSRERQNDLHRSALIKLVECGTRFSRLDPRCGLLVYRNGDHHMIPITHHGFVWETAEFERVLPVPNYTTKSLRNIHRKSGIGIPLLVTSTRKRDHKFFNKNVAFPATMIFRIADSRDHTPSSKEEHDYDRYSIELHDPLRVDEVQIDGQSRPIAKDTSSPFAYRLRDYKGNIVTEFLTPSIKEGESRLVTIEPYQKGKIPIVLIHGLLSDPFTWIEMMNDLLATKGFIENFQIWIFEYPTGQPFFASAANIRQQLVEANNAFDPDRCDPKLSDLVLVGHSMGGLIAKMQVTYSGDQLWRSSANVPLEQLKVSPTMKERLVSAFFFDPSPNVSRVVFIGTPHRGSALSRRPIGRIASSLVSQPEERRASHRELIDNNPGAFSTEVTNRIPSSVDMLNPDSNLLQTIDKLPIAANVQLHSIIGDSRWTLGYGASDGIVPVVSARHPNVQTERLVSETHSKLHKNDETIQELIAILNEHLRVSPNHETNR